jgi:drug/metabolite transporter (DMT)-like permease
MPALQQVCSSGGSVSETESPSIIEKIFGGGEKACSPNWLFVLIAGLCALLYCAALYKYRKAMIYEKKKKWLALTSVLFAFAAIGMIIYAYILCRSMITLGIGFVIAGVILISLKIHGSSKSLPKRVGYFDSVKSI